MRRRRHNSVSVGVILAAAVGGVVSVTTARAGSLYMHFGRDSAAEMQSSNVALYEQAVHELAVDDTASLRAHPLVYRVLTDTALMDHFLAKWEAHTVRFEDRHPYLWRILDGYEHNPELDAHVLVGSAHAHSLIAGADNGLGGNIGGLPGAFVGNYAGGVGGISPDVGGGGGIGTLAVPEPTAIALLGPGIACVVLAASRYRKK